MKIGFVSTWFERGASYVTKSYIELLKDKHEVFVYARGGEYKAKGDLTWDKEYVTWAPSQYATNINIKHFRKWIKQNEIEIVFFNEQQEIEPVYYLKKFFPKIKIGAYIDYYKENTVSQFNIYDFLICNTLRHYSVFKHHKQAYYVPWGTDIDLFSPRNKHFDDVVFFHSAGMSNRKGTTYVIDAFLEGELYKSSKLIIHIQKDFEKSFSYKKADLKKFNIEIIEKTVTAPGLYHLGNVYVYPTKLDGLGLTMYEALACGMPVITTNNAPMNEVIKNDVGRLVDVERYVSRSDAYYWPLSLIDKSSLINEMKYFIENIDILKEMSIEARKQAVEKWNWNDRQKEIIDIFENSQNIVMRPDESILKKVSLDRKIINKIGSSSIYALINKIKK